MAKAKDHSWKILGVGDYGFSQMTTDVMIFGRQHSKYYSGAEDIYLSTYPTFSLHLNVPLASTVAPWSEAYCADVLGDVPE